MKILITYWGRKGGGTQYTYELTKEFVTQFGDEIYTSFSKNSENFDQAKLLTEQSFHIFTFDTFFGFLLNSLFLPIKLFLFYIFLKKNNIDMVYTTMGHVWTPFLSIMLKYAKIKHIFTVHDATTHPGDQTIPFWLNAMIYRNTFKFVFLSKYVSEKFIERFSIDRQNIILTQSGILDYNCQVSTFQRYTEAQPFRLIFFGRILKYKGLEHLLKVQIKLEKIYNDIFLEIYGNGNIAQYSLDIKKIRNIKLENRWIHENEICKIFNKPCINIMPYIEASQSGVIPVALSCAIPSIATNLGGISEQIENNIHGLLLDSENIETDLFDKIQYLYNNRSICNKFSQNCFQLSQTKLSWKYIVKKLYQDLKISL